MQLPIVSADHLSSAIPCLNPSTSFWRNWTVDLFFDGVLERAHHSKVNKLLARERLIRSAYLVYYRQALAEYFVAKGKARDLAEASSKIENTTEEDIDLEEIEED